MQDNQLVMTPSDVQEIFPKIPTEILVQIESVTLIGNKALGTWAGWSMPHNTLCVGYTIKETLWKILCEMENA